jgi:hypothetical protein
MRIYAPCKRSFNHGEINGNYFDDYINELWTQWTNSDLEFTCGELLNLHFTGRVDAQGVLKGKLDGLRAPYQGAEYEMTQNIVVRKPNTQEVLEGKGALAEGHFASLVVQAQICAAINRGVAHNSALWGNPNAYYNQGKPYNFYSKFWHENSYNGLAYGFCYDDVFDQATLLYHSAPTALVMDLKWD